MNLCPHPSRSRRGSALVLVFWCLLILSLAVFAAVEMVSLSMEHASNQESALDARALAATGVAIGCEPQVLVDEPLLHQQLSPRHGYRVTITDEASRININFVLAADHREILVALFTSWGVSMKDAQHAADCLYDWVSPGDLPSLNGAKDAAYAEAGLPQRPTHKPFRSLTEIGLVLGVDRIVAKKPDWLDSITIWSDGPLNVNMAPADRMAAVMGVSKEQADSVVERRNGRDGVAGTSDDVPLTSAMLQAELALSEPQMQALQDQITFGSMVRRIESVGWVGDVRSTICAVTQMSASPPQLYLWSEQ